MALATYRVKRGDNLTKICDGRCGHDVMASISGNTVQARINTLVRLNNIADPNKIIADDILILNKNAASSQPKIQNKNSVTINGFGLQAGSTTGRDMYVYWSWDWANTKHYRVRWEWFINGHMEYETSEITERYSNKTIAAEASYCQIFILPVSHNKLDSKGEDTGIPYWRDEVEEIGQQYQFYNNPPLPPPTPSVDINNNTLTLTASISNIVASELDAVSVKFNIIRDNTDNIHTSGPIAINTSTNYVSYQCNVEPGHTYTVRALTVSAYGKESGWSDLSGSEGTKPSAPIMLIDKCRRVKRTDGSIAAHLEWNAVANAETYIIEYVNTESDFETTPGNIQTMQTDDARTSIEMIISETGFEYYFRVRAVNADGTSDPSGVVPIPLGSTPAAPVTWSTADSAFVGDTMELHWTHNPTDNSKQSSAQLDLSINGGSWVTVGTFENTTDADSTGERVDEVSTDYGKAVSYKGTLYFKMDTNATSVRDTTLRWRVCTRGITNDFSDWSTERTINIYEKPSLALSMTSDVAGTGSIITTLTSFPFYVRAKDSVTGSKVQKPVGYHLQIVSNEYYVTVDDIGRTKTINPGDTVYSKYFSTDQDLIVEMSANNIDLESSIGYTLSCYEDMSTGLVISNQHEFTVDWIEAEYPISANISVDSNSYAALIQPYCAELIPDGPGGKNLCSVNTFVAPTDQVRVINPQGIPVTDDNLYSFSCDVTYLNTAINDKRIQFVVSSDATMTNTLDVSNALADAVTTSILKTGRFTYTFRPPVSGYLYIRMVYQRVFELDNIQFESGYVVTEYEPYYEKYVDGDLIENLTLSVYRREYDGTYTEVSSGIPNNYTTITDPHPALDYARYRFVAKDTLTGAISYYDAPGYPVGCSSIILQWDEEWSAFDTGAEQSIEGPAWSGSLIRLPYNIKVTDSRKPDVELVKYAGRRHPVTYYGTHVGETSTWNADIPKDDKETIYALRRLSLWTGDVYVREPSGMGYWANVEVTFNQSYDALTVPVSLNITRVEGGV